MAWVIRSLSMNPKYCPSFKLLNSDGTPRVFVLPELRHRHAYLISNFSGQRLTESTIPPLSSIATRAIIDGRTKVLPDIFSAGGMCVSQALRDVIEALEPGVHQFIDIELMRTKKEPYEGKYYILRICQILNSVIFEKSNLRIERLPNGREYITSGLNKDNFMTLKKEVVAGKHLWREEILKEYFYMSDELHDIFVRRKFKGIDKYGIGPAYEE